MGISVNDVLSTTVSFISETVETEKIKFNESSDPRDLIQVKSLIADLGFQVDFSLMSSVTEVQELYDIYRNKLADESNIEIRTLLKLANHINIFLNDTYSHDSEQPWREYIDRLADLISIHRNVDSLKTCQDDSICSGMSNKEWFVLLENNPWLVAAVSLQYVPNYYLITIITDLNELVPKGEKGEAQYTH